MKAKFLLAIALLIGVQSFAQTPTPYFTGYDTPPQQAGWQQYRKGFPHSFSWAVGASASAPSAPNVLSHDYPVGGAPALVEDWYVSPMFDFSGGGLIDSFSIDVFSISGTTTIDDHFGVYLINGSQDPGAATVTLLTDLTTLASNTHTWTTLYNIPIPATSGNSYIGLKYTATNNWFVPSFDNLGISAAPGCPAPASIAITPSYLSADFTWPAATGAIGYEIIVNSTATPPTGPGTPISATTHTELGLTLNTNYYVHIRTDCGGGMFSPWKTEPFKTKGGPGPCVEPQLNFAELTETQAKVNWKSVPNAEGYEYTLKQTSEMPSVSGTLTLQNNLTLPGLTPATKYYLFARTRCQGISSWVFSNWVMAEFFTHFPTNVTEANADAVKVYPNPATDVLKIEGLPANTSLIVTDIIGKQLLHVTNTGHNTSLNIRDLPRGLYLIKVLENDGSQYTLKFQKQ